MAPAPLDDALLRRDVRQLGDELGQVLRKHGAPGLLEAVESIRDSAKRRRAGEEGGDAALRQGIAALSTARLADITRAFSTYFDLANLAEDRNRIRVLRQRERIMWPAPRPQSLGAAIEELKERGLDAAAVQAHLSALEAEMVFTAHPTEAKRRTTRASLRRLRGVLAQLERTDLLPREREAALRSLRAEIACLWEVETVPEERPRVIDEVRRSLFVAEPLWESVPRLFRQARRCLARAYPGHAFALPAMVRFGSWIGGDRDGNPFVTPEVTAETLCALRAEACALHLRTVRELHDVLSLTTARHRRHEAMERALTEAADTVPGAAAVLADESPRERYKAFLRVLRLRLEITQSARPEAPAPAGVLTGPGLCAAIALLQECLRADGHADLAAGPLQDWADRALVFGLHFARLDVREDARLLRLSVDELRQRLQPGADAASAPAPAPFASDAEAEAFLLAPVDATAARALLGAEGLSENTSKTFRLFVLLEQATRHFGPECLGMCVASQTSAPRDVLVFPWLQRLAAAALGHGAPASAMPATPLLETIEDLRHGPDILGRLLAHADYRAHVLRCGGRQTCMIGYSDSCKDGGMLASNAHLYEAQRRLSAVVAAAGLAFTFFHGRGGALGRGGGPAAESVLSLPPESVAHRLRITEQGEVLAERYDDQEIATRHLEQILWALLLVSASPQPEPAPEFDAALQKAAEASAAAFRAYRDHPDFLEYFDKASPITTIEGLPIGSRPARRSGQRVLANLRAIPFTFAWTQNRHMLTAFFGVGSGLAAVDDLPLLRRMYKEHRPFRILLQSAELALSKADPDIVRLYATRAAGAGCPGAPARAEAWLREFDLSRRLLLDITGRTELLGAVPWLQRSIQVRNPYVDALNFTQVELMSRGEDPHGEAMRLSVQGVAAGLRTTG